MIRTTILSIFLALGITGTAAAQTAPKADTKQTESRKADTQKKTGTTKEAETAKKDGKDIDSFFKDAEKQCEKEGQSCQPPPEPIV